MPYDITTVANDAVDVTLDNYSFTYECIEFDIFLTWIRILWDSSATVGKKAPVWHKLVGLNYLLKLI